MHISTIWRWAQRGVRGHKLRLVRCGGTYILRSDPERFLAAINDQTPVEVTTPAGGSQSAKVAAELDALKI